MESNLNSIMEKGIKWQTPEKLAFLLGAAAVGSVLFYFSGKILPFVIRTLENGIYAGVLLAFIGAILWVVSNKQFRLAVSYAARNLLRKCISVVWTTDPIGIMELTLQDMISKKDELDENTDKLSGQEGILRGKIEANNARINELLKKAQKSKSLNLNEDFELASIEASGLQSMNLKFEPLYKNIKMMLAYFEKALKAVNFLIKKTSVEIEQKKTEYEMVKQSYKTLNSFKSIIKGDPDKLFMFEKAAEYIQSDMQEKIGIMKRTMEMSTTFMNSYDIETGIISDQGQELLKQYENGELQLLDVSKFDNTQFNFKNEISSGNKQKEKVLVSKNNYSSLLD
jgi:hypothetical protein